MQCLFLTLLALLMMPYLTTAFLGRGTLLENHGDIFNLYCDDFDNNVRVWHHREITREGVRRAVVTYFKVRRVNRDTKKDIQVLKLPGSPLCIIVD